MELTILIAKLQHQFLRPFRNVKMLEHCLLDCLGPESLLVPGACCQFHLALRVVVRDHVEAGRFAREMLHQHEVLALE